MFTKAKKSQSKLRLAIFGPSGSGKTYTALRIATGMGGKIGVLDTERGSSAKYADMKRTGFDFDIAELEEKTIEDYCRGIDAASGLYDILIIDSMSHGWQELLEEIDAIAKAKYKGNTWSAWSDGTPKQKRLVNAILDYRGHVIATMRSKTEWTTTQGQDGKSRPNRVGLAPEQGKGIEYEFDMLMEMTPEHYATIIKDRTGKYQDRIIDRPDEKFGHNLAEWLKDGEEAPAPGLTKPGEMLANMISEAAMIPTKFDLLEKCPEYIFKAGPYIGKPVCDVDDLQYLSTVMNSQKSDDNLKKQCFDQIEKLTTRGVL